MTSLPRVPSPLRRGALRRTTGMLFSVLGLGLLSTQVQASEVACETLIARVGLSGGLQVRVPLQSLTARGQFTVAHLETAAASDLSGMMTDLATVLWQDQQQDRAQWSFSDIHLDGSREWVSLRLRPQASQLQWPQACLDDQLVGAN